MVAVVVSFSVLLPCAHHYHSVSAAFMLVRQHTLCVLCTNETTSLVGGRNLPVCSGVIVLGQTLEGHGMQVNKHECSGH